MHCSSLEFMHFDFAENVASLKSTEQQLKRALPSNILKALQNIHKPCSADLVTVASFSYDRCIPIEDLVDLASQRFSIKCDSFGVFVKHLVCTVPIQV